MICHIHWWKGAIGTYFGIWRRESQDPIEIRQTVNFIRAPIEKANATWLPARNSLAEFQNFHKLGYLETLIEQFDTVFAALNLELRESKIWATCLEEKAAKA